MSENESSDPLEPKDPGDSSPPNEPQADGPLQPDGAVPTSATQPTDGTTADISLTSLFAPLARPTVFRIDCPHCGNQMQIVDDRVNEVTCTTCGSSVRVSSATQQRTSSRAARPLPFQFGHFRIVRVLGEGGFGIVYLGEDLNLDLRRVAIKVPRHGYFATTEEEQRFFREASNAARLRHPHIAQVYEISTEGEMPYIVSEFIDGMTLRDLLATGTLSLKDSVKLVIQIAEAVAFAHRNKIIHRDLKSSNILVDGDHKAYVVDFGLSRRDDAEITMTIDGAVIGTVQYMSPEQALGNQAEVGPLSDVYSLGVILYELLCKELPFHGSKRLVIEQVINQEPPRIQRLNSSVPRDLEVITHKAIAKDPKQRFQSAEEFAEDLRRWLRGEPIHARPVSSLTRFWSWCRRHPAVASLGSTIALLLVLVAILSIAWAIEQERLKKIAVDAQLDSDQKHYDLLMQNGTNALADNDLPSALLWYSEAQNIQTSQSNAIRLGMIQDRTPKLTALFWTRFPVGAIHFDEAGNRLFAADYEGHVQVFNTSTAQSMLAIKVSPFSQIMVSPKGDRFALCGQDNHAELWNVDGRSIIKKLAHTDFVVSTNFDSTGQRLATGSFDAFARVWNAADGTLLAEHKFEGMHVTQVAFVPNSQLVVVIAHEHDQFKNSIHLWNVEQDSIILSDVSHQAHILPIRLADDGKVICSASADGQISIADAFTGKPIREGLTLPFSPRNILFGTSSAEVLTVSHDFDLQVRRLSDGQRVGPEIRSLPQYDSIAQDLQNRLIAVGGVDGVLSVYWRKDGKPACSRLKNGERVTALAFHPDSRRLAAGGKNGVLQVWDLAGATPKASVLQHQGRVSNALFSPDGQRCFTVSADGKAKIWNAQTGQLMGTELDHGGGIVEATIGEDGRLLITGGLNKQIKLWDAYSGQPIGKELVHPSEVVALAIDNRARHVVGGCFDGSVVCWDLQAAKATPAPSPRFVVKHDNRITDVVFSKDGSMFATSSLDGKIRCWESATGQQLYGPFDHKSRALCCAFLPDGQHLLSTGADRWVRIWELSSGQLVESLECDGEVVSAMLTTDGRILTTESKGQVRVWKRQAGRFQLDFQTRHPAIEAIAYCDIDLQHAMLAFGGGTLVQSANVQQSGAAALWDMHTARPLAPLLPHLAPVYRVRFNNTGTQLLTASDDHTAKLWDLAAMKQPTADILKLARLLSQMQRQSSGRLVVMPPEIQLATFTELASQFPSFFQCNADEIAHWNEDTQRFLETQK